MARLLLSLGILTAFLHACGVLAAVPSGAITVGSSGKYKTLSAALKDTSRYVQLNPRVAPTVANLP